MTSSNNNNANTPPALLGPPRPKRITSLASPVPPEASFGNEENAAPNFTSVANGNGGGGGIFGALPGIWRGGSTAPPHHGTATATTATTIPTAAGDSAIGSNERRLLLTPNFQPVAFGEQQRDTPQAVATTGDPLSSLPIDTWTTCLAHLTAVEIDALRLTSKTNLGNCTTSPVWKVLCHRTGKLLPQDVVPSITSSSQIEDAVSSLPSSQSTRFFDRYRSTICVPEDVGDIPTVRVVETTVALTYYYIVY